MAQENVDYAVVLRDLESRRTALDQMIALTRQLAEKGFVSGVAADDGTVTEPRPGQPAATAGSMEIHPGVFHGLSAGDAARKFLEMTKTTQRTKDIVDALQRGGVASAGQNFYSNVYTTLMRRKDFRLIGKAWALTEWHPTVGMPAEKPTKAKRKAKGKAPKARPTKPGLTLAETKPGSPMEKPPSD